jgi:hypothetical protein
MMSLEESYKGPFSNGTKTIEWPDKRVQYRGALLTMVLNIIDLLLALALLSVKPIAELTLLLADRISSKKSHDLVKGMPKYVKEFTVHIFVPLHE